MPCLRTSRSLTAAAVAALLFAAAGCGSDAVSDTAAGEVSTEDTVEATVAPAAEAGAVTVTGAWSREPAPGQTAAAVYAEVTNATDQDRRIIAATSSVTDVVELHETVIDDDGVATMQERGDGFTVAAGQTLLFEPAGAHVMLRDIDPATYGDSVDVTFEFDDGESIEVTAEVRSLLPGEAAEHDHSDHDHTDDEHDHSDHDHTDDEHDHSDHDHTDEDATADEHDHADHDHTDEDATADAHDHADHDHGDGGETLDLDVGPLHGLDEELAAGTLDAAAQREVVAAYVTELEALDPAAESQTMDLLEILRELDAALEAEELDAAAALAVEAHDLAHVLVPHS